MVVIFMACLLNLISKRMYNLAIFFENSNKSISYDIIGDMLNSGKYTHYPDKPKPIGFALIIHRYYAHA